MKKLMLTLLGLILIALLLWQSDFREITSSLASVSKDMLLFACFLQIITIYLICLQWQLIAKKMGCIIPFKNIFHINMAGTFVESVTPAAKAGGEAAKVVLLKPHLNNSTSQALALVGLQKTISMVCFLFLCIVSLSWFLLTFSDFGTESVALIIGLLFIIAFVALLGAFIKKPMLIHSLVAYLPVKESFKDRICTSMTTIDATIKSALKDKYVLTSQLILSTFIWLFFAVKSYYIALSLQVDIGFIAIAVITYLTYMVAMVPITPGGLGTFEGSMVLLLAPLGVALHEALLLALIIRFVTFWFVFAVSALYLGGQQLLKSFD
ncbi:lysylphosphatidylglycerol synthase transmembrane domain-containing protein [Desulfuribacillus alkaliarsenatis]|uniref:Phosphatidylglycerol lysyltransferase n=1 Tax=Desulfuribacillus alkaliarsenatis TaxID=766136 RepID=A0A1E5G3V7_9FIRM|nr:lysylphosphatidylglycerol synthase transmembrane domain-containing protein [Desulfuribacillus alkaliarsenatis]OEF97762.1 hypothetical protein BHF68_13815 [Desulfuribacillus alkaliarsenatis]